MERRLRRWQQLAGSRPFALDASLAAVLSVAATWDWRFSHDPPWRLPFQILLAASVLGRRRFPLIAFAVAAGSALAIRASPGLEGAVALAVCAYSVGAYSRARWRSLVVLLVIEVAVMSTGNEASLTLLAVVLAWLAGDTMRDDRNARAALARERAASDAGAQLERARIARDLHDVVAHGVSVIVIRAEAAKNLMSRDPARALEDVEAISNAGRQALRELRQLMYVLGPGDDAPMTPVPSAMDIEKLVSTVRATGQDVTINVDGDPSCLDPGLSQAAYRIVQEGLTNAVRHAKGAPTLVRVSCRADAVELEVVNGRSEVLQNPSVGAGSGLGGIRERVRLLGGEMSAAPTQEGGFAVRAILPRVAT